MIEAKQIRWIALALGGSQSLVIPGRVCLPHAVLSPSVQPVEDYDSRDRVREQNAVILLNDLLLNALTACSRFHLFPASQRPSRPYTRLDAHSFLAHRHKF